MSTGGVLILLLGVLVGAAAGHVPGWAAWLSGMAAYIVGAVIEALFRFMERSDKTTGGSL